MCCARRAQARSTSSRPIPPSRLPSPSTSCLPSPTSMDFCLPYAKPDREGLLAAIRKGSELMATSPLKEMTGEEIAPGAHLKTDDEILEWVRNNAETTYHPVGTCKMGNEPMAGVDP